MRSSSSTRRTRTGASLTPRLSVGQPGVDAEGAVVRAASRCRREAGARSRMPTMPWPPPSRSAGAAPGWSPRSRAPSARSRSRPRAAAAVPGRVGERLLEDPVGGLVDRRAERAPRAVDRDVTAAGDPVALGERVERGEARRRSTSPSGRSSRRARTSWSISPSVSRATSSTVRSAAGRPPDRAPGAGGPHRPGRG